jgi:hypothetical protein
MRLRRGEKMYEERVRETAEALAAVRAELAEDASPPASSAPTPSAMTPVVTSNARPSGRNPRATPSRSPPRRGQR